MVGAVETDRDKWIANKDADKDMMILYEAGKGTHLADLVSTFIPKVCILLRMQ